MIRLIPLNNKIRIVKVVLLEVLVVHLRMERHRAVDVHYKYPCDLYLQQIDTNDLEVCAVGYKSSVNLPSRFRNKSSVQPWMIFDRRRRERLSRVGTRL